MALFTTPIKDGKHVANLLPQNDPIYILDNTTDVDFETGKVKTRDDISKGASKLKILHAKEYFFPQVTNFKDKEQNDRIYICGKSGSGKSFHFIRPYIIEYHSMYPKNKILLFSSKVKDRALDDLKYMSRVIVDDDLLENPIEITQLEGTLCIFDDIEDFPKKTITKAVLKLLEELLRNGRSQNTFILYTHHQPTDYKNTRLMLHEATAIVIFPCAETGGQHDYDYLLDKYLPISELNKKIIINCRSKYVYISKSNPQIIISDKYILTDGGKR